MRLTNLKALSNPLISPYEIVNNILTLGIELKFLYKRQVFYLGINILAGKILQIKKRNTFGYRGTRASCRKFFFLIIKNVL